MTPPRTRTVRWITGGVVFRKRLRSSHQASPPVSTYPTRNPPTTARQLTRNWARLKSRNASGGAGMRDLRAEAAPPASPGRLGAPPLHDNHVRDHVRQLVR